VLGFIGLSRLLVTYIQLTMAILPIFVLITTVRSVAGDREAGVFEYLLSLPVGLAAWFWGKILGRYLVIFLPVFAAMAGAVRLGAGARHRGALGHVRLLHGCCSPPWAGASSASACWSRRWRAAPTSPRALAFMVWLTLLLFLDLILLGVMIQGQVGMARPRWRWASRWPTRCRCSAPRRWRCSIRS
jgi:ABC-2 type transport system permease protein